MTEFIDNDYFDIQAKAIVKQYVAQHPKDEDEVKKYKVYIVWKSKILKNYKYLIATNREDGEYYEVMFNGGVGYWYLDVYQKVEHKCLNIDDAREFR